MSKLTIEHGAAVGAFEYVPKGATAEPKSPSLSPVITPSQDSLTLEQIDSWTPEQVNANWSKVKEVMKNPSQ